MTSKNLGLTFSDIFAVKAILRKDGLISHMFLMAGLLSLLISFSQFFRPYPLSSHVAIESHQRNLVAPDMASSFSARDYLTGTSFLPTPFHIQSHLPVCLLFALFPKVANKNETYTEEASLHPNVFFKIVFRLIISPNGP